MRALVRTAWIVTVLAALAVPYAARGAADPNLAGELKYEGDYRYGLIAGISAYEMWHSSETTILSSVGTLIRYFEFDWESAPRDGAWTVQGIVLVGSGDIKAQPIALKFWAKDRTRLQSELSHKLSLEGMEAVAIFTPSLVECTAESDCSAQQFRFTVNANGEAFVGKTKIGSIK